MKFQAAPWSRAVVVISAGVTAGCLVISGVLCAQAEVPLLVALGPALLVVVVLPFRIRRYEWTNDGLRVERMFWTTRVAPAGLVEARHDPAALRGSVRLLGIGGLFVIDGWFWNRRLGRYRACLTDPGRAVVLRFPGRTVVISPADPGAFVAGLPKPTSAPQGSGVPEA